MKFTKMHGLGNDYIFIDLTKSDSLKNISEKARRFSNRHFGIGGDGLILIEKSDRADFKMRIFNSDGSEAEMCGNGIRCFGKYVYEKGLTKKNIITVETLAGIKTLFLTIDKGEVKEITVDMGIPVKKANRIPMIEQPINENECSILIDGRVFNFFCISMGNPHAVTEVEDLNEIDLKNYGSKVENYYIFPEKTNVEFIKVLGKKQIEMRVWERGSGETFACGTGACASVVACVLQGKTEREVLVNLPGGVLKISWNSKNNHVYMTGSATIVFDGEFKEN